MIQEFANVGLRKFAQRFANDDYKQFIEVAMQPVNHVANSPELINAALDLQSETRYSFYGSLMLASALQADCKTVYT